MTTTSVGREAEKRVADELQKRGYRLIAQNWRTRWCEIDLIMHKARTTYFIEVKYRASDAYGGGLEYITTKKLKQMKFAAEYWLSNNDEYEEAVLACVEVSPQTQEFELVELV